MSIALSANVLYLLYGERSFRFNTVFKLVSDFCPNFLNVPSLLTSQSIASGAGTINVLKYSASSVSGLLK